MKIGVFDSGFGGLSVLAKLMERLPAYDYVYMGDAARAPYGTRAPEDVIRYTKQAIDFFAAQDCSLVILACNTASALALRTIQQTYLPAHYPGMNVLGVLIPAAEAAAAQTQRGRIGVMATPATVASASFIEEIDKLAPTAQVTQVACEQLVPLIEAGASQTALRPPLEAYCQQLRRHEVDTVILGCTHYELIKPLIASQLDATIISEGAIVAQKLADYLVRHADIASQLSQQGSRQYATTGDPVHFAEQAQQLVGIQCQARHVVIAA